MSSYGPVKSMSIVDGFKSNKVMAVPPAATRVIFLSSSLSTAVSRPNRPDLSSGIVQPHFFQNARPVCRFGLYSHFLHFPHSILQFFLFWNYVCKCTEQPKQPFGKLEFP